MTSLSPAFLVVGVNQLEHRKWMCGAIWIGITSALTFVCLGLLKYLAKNGPEDSLYIKEFESKDQEILSYLFIYLLPFIQSDNPTFASMWITAIVSLAIITLFIAHVGAFHYNPVMSIFRYQFYAIRNTHGVSYLLISNTNIPRPDRKLQTVRIARYVHLYTEKRNV